jgi:Tfp pilus assembly protein PilN
MVDLNKEIKLSELFRRSPKASAETPEATETPAVAAEAADAPGEKKGFLKRDISFGRKGPKEPKPERGKRERKPKKQKAERGRRAKSAPQPLPAVPLMRAFDLLPREDGREDGGRRPSTAQLVLAAAALVLVAALASVFLVTNARVADKATEVNDLRSRLAALEQPQEEPKPALEGSDQALVQERDNRTGALGTVLARRVGWDRVLRDISLVLPDGVWLETLTATAATPTDATQPGAPAPVPDPTAAPGTSTVEISGFGKTQASIAQLLSRMAVLPEIQAVQLASASAEEIGGQTVFRFSLSATLKPAGAAASGGTA